MASKKKPEWQALGSVMIDTARLMLIDPMHVDIDFVAGNEGEFPVGDHNATGVITETGMGDGRYLVEGRYADSVSGGRLAEIRVRFLDEEGSWLGGYAVDEGSESSDS